MMNAMHARRDQHDVQRALEGKRHAQIAVMEKRAELKGELIDDVRRERGPDQKDLGGAESGREADLDEVKAKRSGDIQIGVDVVRVMEAPQERDAVIGHMPAIEAQIKEQECRRDF